MDACMATFRHAGMEVWRPGGMDGCLLTCRRVGMKVWRGEGPEASMLTCRSAGIEGLRSGDVEVRKELSQCRALRKVGYPPAQKIINFEHGQKIPKPHGRLY